MLAWCVIFSREIERMEQNAPLDCNGKVLWWRWLIFLAGDRISAFLGLIWCYRERSSVHIVKPRRSLTVVKQTGALTVLQKGKRKTLITHKYHDNQNNSRSNGNLPNLARDTEKCFSSNALSTISQPTQLFLYIFSGLFHLSLVVVVVHFNLLVLFGGNAQYV